MIEIAIEAAKKGGEILLKYFETELEHEVKDDKTFVTKADRESEAAIMGHIKSRFPDHSFLAEESGETSGHPDSEYTWVIDPLDGTANFVNGLPMWAISIGLLKGNEVVGAVIYNPLINLLVHAEKGKGLTCNGLPSHISEQGTDAAMITVGCGKAPGVKDQLAAIFRETPKHLKYARYIGSCALELAILARGGTEGFVCLGNSKWDYAAGTLLVVEGGGMITDIKGGPWSFENNYFVASNKIIHPELLKVLDVAGVTVPKV